MQKTMILALILLSACQTRESFETKISAERNRSISSVSKAGEGLPFFTKKILNPVWKEDDSIVRIPETLKLIDQNGMTIDQSFFKGKVTVIGFFFASCGGFCPTLIENMKRVETKLGRHHDFQMVAITVDPESDEPSVLKDYVKKTNLNPKHWTLLTGDQKVIYSLAKETFASQVFQRVAVDGPRSFVHSEHLYVIDPDGRLRAIENATRKDTPKKIEKVVAEI